MLHSKVLTSRRRCLTTYSNLETLL